MIRTQIYLTKEEKKGLESLSSLKGVSQSDLIRQAIDDLLTRTNKVNKLEIIEDIAGIWEKRVDLPEIREMRTRWSKRTSR